jgi:hypothetical protein
VSEARFPEPGPERRRSWSFVIIRPQCRQQARWVTPGRGFTDLLTGSYIKLAHINGIPVVGVYETMPTPGYDYQS